MNYLFLFSGIGIGFLIATIMFYIVVVKMVFEAKKKTEDKGEVFNNKLLSLWEERNDHSAILVKWAQENWNLADSVKNRS